MFILPKLDYNYSDLEPYIDGLTMEIHHTKHHQSYIDNLNKAVEDLTEYKDIEVEKLLGQVDEIPVGLRQAVINHGGGHANHSFFWKILTPKKNEPNGDLKSLLISQFGSLDSFKEKFSEKAMTVFGSGWAFLIMDKDKKLRLKRHSFQNSPLIDGNIPVLGIDVWEHAYYLNYQNRRKDYIDAFWNVVNWNQVEENFNKAK